MYNIKISKKITQALICAISINADIEITQVTILYKYFSYGYWVKPKHLGDIRFYHESAALFREKASHQQKTGGQAGQNQYESRSCHMKKEYPPTNERAWRHIKAGSNQCLAADCLILSIFREPELLLPGHLAAFLIPCGMRNNTPRWQVFHGLRC